MDKRMKANELRIGNYIIRNGFKPEIVDGWKMFAKIEQVPDWYFPIPLTEEWLLKFGFEKTESDNSEELYLWSIQIANNTSLYFNRDIDEWYLSHEWNSNHFKNDFWNKPKYVHQLQNLYFALTGEELQWKRNLK